MQAVLKQIKMENKDDFWKTSSHEEHKKMMRKKNIVRFIIVFALAFAYFYFMLKYYK